MKHAADKLFSFFKSVYYQLNVFDVPGLPLAKILFFESAFAIIIVFYGAFFGEYYVKAGLLWLVFILSHFCVFRFLFFSFLVCFWLLFIVVYSFMIFFVAKLFWGILFAL